MVTLDGAGEIALELPEVTEGERHGTRSWSVAAQPKAFFTIPHFDGYPAVLIQLNTVSKRALREAIIDGWLSCAPSKLADEYVARDRARRRGMIDT
jgi:hypothetical protein